MKKLMVALAVLAVLGGAAYLLRVPLALAALDRSTSFQNPAWGVLASAPDHPDVQAFVRQYLIDLYATWRRGEKVNLTWDMTGAFSVYRAHKPQLDDEIATALVGLCVASGSCTWSPRGRPRLEFRSDPYDYASYIPDFASNPAVDRGLTDHLEWLARLPGPTISRTFSPCLEELARRGVHDDPRLTSATAHYALAHTVYSDESEQLDEIFQKVADPASRAAAWQGALVETASLPELPQFDTGLALALDDLAAIRPPLDAATPDAVLVLCQRYSQSRLNEACIDFSLAYPTLAPELVRRARAGGDEAQTTFAETLDQEVRALRGRTPDDIVTWWEALPASKSGDPDPPNKREEGHSFTVTDLGRRGKRDLAALVAWGDEALPALYRGFGSRQRGLVSLSAVGLTRLDLLGFSREMLDRIDAFEPHAWEYIQRSDYDHPAFLYSGTRVAAGLRALAGVDGSRPALYPWLRALSIPEPGFSKRAATFLRERLSADEFANALFGFLAVREEFRVAEVDIYRNTLVSYPDVSPAIERNLRVLLEVWDEPESVPWIHKVIALEALAQVGEPSTLDVLAIYATDPGGYYKVQVRKDDPSQSTREPEEFATLVRRAQEAIRSRAEQGGAAGS